MAKEHGILDKGKPKWDIACTRQPFSSFCTCLVSINADGSVGVLGRSWGDLRGEDTRSRYFLSSQSGKDVNAVPGGFLSSLPTQVVGGAFG